MPRAPHEIQVSPTDATDGTYRLTRPNARYAVDRSGADEHAGVWIPATEPLPPGWVDTFPEAEARSLVYLLRELGRRPAGKGGRPPATPTTPDGQLIERAKRGLGVTGIELARAIGVHETVLSRALHGELTDVQRDKIEALVATDTKTK